MKIDILTFHKDYILIPCNPSLNLFDLLIIACTFALGARWRGSVRDLHSSILTFADSSWTGLTSLIWTSNFDKSLFCSPLSYGNE